MIDRRRRWTSRSSFGLFIAFGLVIGAMTLTACTPEPLQFADWTIPVPEGTPVIEYAAVPMEERTEKIELVKDLVIDRGDSPDSAFYRPSSLAVDRKGRIYVLDSGNNRVQVFDPSGGLVCTLGGEGEGPGELSRPSHIVIAGEQVVVADQGNRKFSFWDLNGSHIQDVSLPFRGRPVDVYSSAGELLFSGLIPQTWNAALDDHVYVLEEDPQTEEHIVARYRLVEPLR